MLCFKFQQNQFTLIDKFDIFEGRRGEGAGVGGNGTLFINFNLNYYWYTYKTVLF